MLQKEPMLRTNKIQCMLWSIQRFVSTCLSAYTTPVSAQSATPLHLSISMLPLTPHSCLGSQGATELHDMHIARHILFLPKSVREAVSKRRHASSQLAAVIWKHDRESRGRTIARQQKSLTKGVACLSRLDRLLPEPGMACTLQTKS